MPERPQEKQKRKAHIISKQKKIQVPRFRIYFDSESRVDDETLEHIPYLICATFIDSRYDRKKKRVYEFDDIKNFWVDVARFGNKEKNRVIVYAHNAGYDTITTAGVPALVNLGYRVNGFFEKGLAFMLELRNEDTQKTIQIISTTNYYPTSIKKLGEAFGLEKLEFDYQEGEHEKAIIYCQRDVDILEKAMETYIAFIQEEKLGTLGVTTPSQAFNAYRYRFMKHDIFIHDIEKATDTERAAYYGGRTECWYIGRFTSKDLFWKYDVNSMYPYVMMKNLYPVKLRTYRKILKLDEAEQILSKGFGMCGKCKVLVNEAIYPVKLNNILIFPRGEFWTYLSTPEIAYGLKHNVILEMEEVSVYYMKNIFAEYIDYFYTKRLQAKAEHDKVKDLLYKLFMNSLYGKFGQRANKMIKIGDAPPEKVEVLDVWDRDTGERYTLKTFGGGTFRETGQFEEAFNAFCAVASHVTAYARMHLWEYILKAGPENVYYMDTDSLFVNHEGRERLKEIESDTELGGMKLEEKTETIIINAPKDYTFGNTTKRKGITKGSIEIDQDTYETLQFPKINTFLREGQLYKYHNVKRVKKLSGKYYKGWILDTGKVVPLEMKTNSTGGNEVRAWEDTSYYLMNERLKNTDQITDISNKFKGYYAAPINESEIYQQILWKEEEAEKKKLRKLILEMGGINDKDYDFIPKYLKRKKGRGLDELAGELKEFGYGTECANDVYSLISKL